MESIDPFNKSKKKLKINRKVICILFLFIIFLIILWFFNGFNFDIDGIILCMLLTIFLSIIWMLVPMIFRIKFKEKIENKRGIKLCAINSIVIFSLILFYCIMLILKYQQIDETISFSPKIFAIGLIKISLLLSIIYYFINYLLFVQSKQI